MGTILFGISQIVGNFQSFSNNWGQYPVFTKERFFGQAWSQAKLDTDWIWKLRYGLKPGYFPKNHNSLQSHLNQRVEELEAEIEQAKAESEKYRQKFKGVIYYIYYILF